VTRRNHHSPDGPGGGLFARRAAMFAFTTVKLPKQSFLCVIEGER
jgi:hypothetical protein